MKSVDSDHQSHPLVRDSMVCTHPEFRGHGYARDLTTFLASQILAAGNTPFLHVKSENGAKVVYQKIGFHLRAAICLTVIPSTEDIVRLICTCEKNALHEVWRRIPPLQKLIVRN